MRLPDNGQVGMSKGMAEMLCGQKIEKDVDEVIFTLEDGEIVDISGRKF